MHRLPDGGLADLCVYARTTQGAAGCFSFALPASCALVTCDLTVSCRLCASEDSGRLASYHTITGTVLSRHDGGFGSMDLDNCAETKGTTCGLKLLSMLHYAMFGTFGKPSRSANAPLALYVDPKDHQTNSCSLNILGHNLHSVVSHTAVLLC